MTSRKTVFEAGQRYVASGISVVPVRLDGSKASAVPWKPFQSRLATDEELRAWFLQSDHGIGVCCGDVSGGLEVLDFDDGSLFAPWSRIVSSIVATLSVVRTPSNGRHVIYRCDQIGGNAKIAMDPSREKKTLIESRGVGGYIIGVGSPANAHMTRKPYVHIAGPHPWAPRSIRPEDREQLWRAARTFNLDAELMEQATHRMAREPMPGNSLADVNPVIAKFNAKHPIGELLQRHGWTSRNGSAWTRPGKPFGVSATIVYAQDGTQLLRVFTSSTNLPMRSLNAFEIYKRLEFDGDNRAAFKAAAQDVTD